MLSSQVAMLQANFVAASSTCSRDYGSRMRSSRPKRNRDDFRQVRRAEPVDPSAIGCRSTALHSAQPPRCTSVAVPLEYAYI
jgi:hypothetical protein